MRFRIFMACGFVVALASAGSAAERFIAVVSGYSTGGCNFLSFPVTSPSVEWFVDHASQTVPRWAADIRSLRSADGQSVFAIDGTSWPGLHIVRLEFNSKDPNQGRGEFFQGLPSYSAGSAMAVSKNGRVYVAIRPVSGTSSDGRVAVIAGDGTLESIVVVPAQPVSLAIASDDCTLLYGDYGSVIHRVDACTGTSLPDFAVAGGAVSDLVALRNGDVLVTTRAAARALQRFDARGILVRTYSIVNTYPYDLDSVAVSSDESTVIVAAMGYCMSRGWLIALSTADGRELWRRGTSQISSGTGLAVGSPPQGKVRTSRP